MQTNKQFSESDWDMQERDWSGKCFYYIPITNVLGKPVGLTNKIMDITREARKAGYTIISNMILIEHSNFGGKIMVEVEKKDQYNANILTLDDGATVDTIVHRGPVSSVGQTIKKAKERVASRRSMQPRAIYYWLVTGIGSQKTVVFALS